MGNFHRLGRPLILLLATSGLSTSCGDAMSVQSNPANEAQASPVAPAATASGVVPGPNGEALFRIEGPGPNSSLNFLQVARAATEGKIININRNFKLTRLPATFKATLDTGEICTATLIGPRVLLTAAHCVDLKFQDGGIWKTVKGSVSRSTGGGSLAINSCAMAPAYTASQPVSGSVRNENDFALCDLVADFNGVRAENVSVAPAAVPIGQQLMLAGFGCTNSDLTNGAITRATRTTGVLNVGFNTVQTANSNGWLKLEGRVGTDAAILCPGDSGGAAFSGVVIDARNDHGWKVVAINSAVGLGPKPSNPSYISYLAPLSDPDFQSFMISWALEKPRRKICGVHISAPANNCRF